MCNILSSCSAYWIPFFTVGDSGPAFGAICTSFTSVKFSDRADFARQPAKCHPEKAATDGPGLLKQRAGWSKYPIYRHKLTFTGHGKYVYAALNI